MGHTNSKFEAKERARRESFAKRVWDRDEQAHRAATEVAQKEMQRTVKPYNGQTVVLTQLNLVKFKVECSKNFFTWIQGQIFNSIEFQWQAQGDGYLLDNVWKSTKDGKFWCPSSRFGQFSKAFLMAAAEFAELDLSEATESSTDDSQVTGYYMYDDGAFRASIEKIHGGGTVFVDSNARLIRPKKLGKGIHDLLVPE